MDHGYNGLLQYSLNIADSFFDIDIVTGKLFTRQRPLTEIIKQKANKSAEFYDYKLEILVQDSPLNKSLIKSVKNSITIRIHGSNLNKPVFEKVKFFWFILKNRYFC